MDNYKMTEELIELLRKSVKDQELMSETIKAMQTRMNECDKEREQLRDRVVELEHLPKEVEQLNQRINLLVNHIEDLRNANKGEVLTTINKQKNVRTKRS